MWQSRDRVMHASARQPCDPGTHQRETEAPLVPSLASNWFRPPQPTDGRPRLSQHVPIWSFSRDPLGSSDSFACFLMSLAISVGPTS
ncbi:uncharacterized protein K452DRAFT_13325 [Aplosporella prunicola CBS 121167]|uniref:Uncharacterized protein n=1 Tax=Aplosporella prunicola CBS 121167 TaxID=1176127 RepID=A0A6A6BHY0_9PEZI|nr:uncharacterized protein K452DRAFT_13325 [Aplosporella prunicola CBS 121167]KAF2142945.1 hypothetical protein K452DRAFT_13325 [Aplosporella prunicola CBS 121167]